MNDGGFWLSVLAVVLLGLLGGILFKYGTEQLGTISLQRLLEVEFSGRFWLYAGLMIGGLLLFVFGGWNLREDAFAMQYLFSPIVFGALVLMFMSRFLVGIPLSATGLGRLTTITTSLLLLTTTVASVVIFQEQVNLRRIAGIAMSIVAVVLLGGA